MLYSGGTLVPVMHVVKYLGVTLDSKLIFTRHIREVSAAVMASSRAVGRLMLNVRGLSVSKRRLLAAIVTIRLLYAAPVWATSASRFRVNISLTELNGWQRFALRSAIGRFPPRWQHF